MSPLRSDLPALLLALTGLSGCGQTEAKSVDLVETPLLLGSSDEPEPTCAAWLDGEAWLRIKVTGMGHLTVRASLEGQPSELLIDTPCGGSLQRHSARIPGAGPRPLLLHFATSGDAQLEDAALARQPHASLPPSSRLAGSMRSRNVLVLVADSVHAAHTSQLGNGNPTTPVLDQLARDGVSFHAAYSPCAWTLPSVASLFTSQEQERHGVLYLDQRLGKQLTTLAELYSDAGYRTEALIQNGVVGPASGLDRGFESYKTFKWGPKGVSGLLSRVHRAMTVQDNRPLFLYVHLAPPHQPYTPPDEFRGRFSDLEYLGSVEGTIHDCGLIQAAKLPADHPDVLHLAALYDENLCYSDQMTGQIVKQLEQNSPGGFLLVATSDHGEAFMQHGHQGHNSQVYEEMVHVPLVMTAEPNPFPIGLQVHEPITLLDLMPTLRELCALGEPHQAPRGASVLGLLEGTQTSSPRLMFFSSRYKKDGSPGQFGVRIGQKKLITSGAQVALYDLDRDPGELRSIAVEEPVLTAALMGELDRWRRSGREHRAPTSRVRITGRRAEQIKILGYGGGND